MSLLVLAGLAYLANGRATSHRHATSKPAAKPRVRQAKTPAAVGLTGVTLQHPYGLTVAPNGTLYIVDAGRDQVLRRLPNGRFKVVAGNGRAGGLGDGGPATKAELRLHGRLRHRRSERRHPLHRRLRQPTSPRVLPNGTIKTVAGDGHDGWLYGASPALAASIGSVAGLAIGPNGDLYIAANNVLRLTTDGMLDWVAGTRFDRGLPACGSIECNPAGEVDLSEPDNLAFDAAGDLFVSDNNGFGLYEVAANGTLSYLGQFRGDGAPGALATAPNGTVIEAGAVALSRLIPSRDDRRRARPAGTPPCSTRR